MSPAGHSETAPEMIDCIDCGGRCHLMSRPDDTGRFWPGDLITYRCEDCADRWDLVVPDDDGVLDPEDTRTD